MLKCIRCCYELLTALPCFACEPIGIGTLHRRYFQHAHLIPIVGVGNRGAYLLVHSNLPRQSPVGTTLSFTGPVSADSRQ